MGLREILIAHPMEPIRKVLKQQILAEYSDIHIRDVDSGTELIKALTKKIDCIFSYNDLPDMKFPVLVACIRANEVNTRTPVIPIISKDSLVKKNMLEKEGFVNILEFPEPVSVLKKIIDKVSDIRTGRIYKRYNIQDAVVIFHEMNEEVEAELINISKGGLLCNLKYKKQSLYLFQKNLVTVMISLPKFFEIRYVVCKLVNLHIIWDEKKNEPDILRMALRFSYISEENKESIDNLIEMAEKMELPSIRDPENTG